MDDIDYLKRKGKGYYGSVYESNKKNIVIKVINHKYYNNNEYIFAKKAGELGIGPKIYKKVKKNNNILIYMKKVDIMLNEWLLKKHTKKIYKDTYKKLLLLVTKLHENNIVHGDIHMGNIGMLKKRWVLIDFGKSHNIKNNKYSHVNIIRFITRTPLYSNKGYENYFKKILVPYNKLPLIVKLHMKILDLINLT
jgi:tRNA A-37 threonylcarbamoyl transferase component Bud32